MAHAGQGPEACALLLQVGCAVEEQRAAILQECASSHRDELGCSAAVFASADALYFARLACGSAPRVWAQLKDAFLGRVVSRPSPCVSPQHSQAPISTVRTRVPV